MTYSMTGFARVESNIEDPSIQIQIRAVNHRQLDIKTRSPQELESADQMIRRVVRERVKRGQLQISISLSSDATPALELNRPLVDAYLAAYSDLAEAAGVETPPDLTALLRTPGVVSQGTREPVEGLDGRVESVLIETIDKLNEERAREGATVVGDVKARTETIAKGVGELRVKLADTVPLFQAKLRSRLEELLGQAGIEPQRILQEAAVLADRTDISEELQRLEAHTARLLDMLDTGGEVGKRLDFLAQEMNREANTLLSKTNPLGPEGLPVTEIGLSMKAEVEKIREQAQNLE